MDDGSSTWAWGICTYRRHDVLRQAFRTVAQQTRPPHEVIVVDSSPNWQEGEALLRQDWAELRAKFPHDARFFYEQGARPSSAAQRNQALALSQADVIFFMDDDTLLYPDCAAKIMEVYEADSERRVQAVAAFPVKEPPLTGPTPQATNGSTAVGAVRRYSPVTRLIRRFLQADDRFVPYDREFPDHPIPTSLAHLPVVRRRLIAGYCLTVRREGALREAFDQRLERYCPGEDSDMTYRLSRHGPLLARLDAKVCHLEAPSGRMNLFPKTAMGAINPLLMHRQHSTDLELSRDRNRRLLMRRLGIETLKDLRQGQLGLPQARGILFALSNLSRILDTPEDRIDQTFRDYQQNLLGRT